MILHRPEKHTSLGIEYPKTLNPQAYTLNPNISETLACCSSAGTSWTSKAASVPLAALLALGCCVEGRIHMGLGFRGLGLGFRVFS